MNEKILELADKAYNENRDIIGYADIPDQFCYAFSELIIKECAEIAGCNSHVSGFALGDLVKEHFGIKN